MDAETVDLPPWGLFREVNRSQWLYLLVFPQVRMDVQERRMEESPRAASFLAPRHCLQMYLEDNRN